MSEHSIPNHDPERDSRRVPKGLAIVVLSTAILAACEANASDGSSDHTDAAPVSGEVLEAPRQVPRELYVNGLFQRAYPDQQNIDLDPSKQTIVTFELHDGEFITTDLAPGLKLSDPDLAPIKAAVLDNKVELMAAHDVGTLEAISFDFDPLLPPTSDGYPLYFSAHKESPLSEASALDTIHYSLPTQGLHNTENISTMIGHESLHAIVERLGIITRNPNDISSGETIPVDVEHYARICTSLRDIAVREASPRASASMYALSSLARLVPPEYQEIFTDVLKSMQDGSFVKYQAKQGEAHGMWESTLQSCGVDDPWQVIVREVKSRGLPVPDTSSEQAADLYVSLRSEWENVLSDRTFYKALRENTYFTPGTQKNDSAGHPYDNANELVASFINVILRFPDEVRSNLEKLPSQQQKLLKELLVLASDDIIRLHKDTAPEFTNQLKEAVARVIQ